MNKNEHLSFEERKTIAERLTERASFKAIGKELGKDCTTISKEVRKHISKVQTGAMGKPYNNCLHRFSCAESWICSECTYRKAQKNCRLCNKCNSVSQKYEPVSCKKLTKPPYVCNGCPDKHLKCTLEKHLCIPKFVVFSGVGSLSKIAKFVMTERCRNEKQTYDTHLEAFEKFECPVAIIPMNECGIRTLEVLKLKDYRTQIVKAVLGEDYLPPKSEHTDAISKSTSENYIVGIGCNILRIKKQ